MPMKLHRRLLSGFLLLIYIITSVAEEQSVRPGINQNYENPEFDQWVSVFESPNREVYALQEKIVEATGIKKGMQVADIGSGTGFFSRSFARKVEAGGKVYAVDISSEFVDKSLKIASAAGLNNIFGIVNSPTDSMLPVDVIDVAFICDTYHHFEYPESMLASIHRALRPDGRVIIIDYRKKPGFSSDWVMQHVRADKEQVIQELEKEGFKFIGEETFLMQNYFLEFRKTKHRNNEQAETE